MGWCVDWDMLMNEWCVCYWSRMKIVVCQLLIIVCVDLVVFLGCVVLLFVLVILCWL